MGDIVGWQIYFMLRLFALLSVRNYIWGTAHQKWTFGNLNKAQYRLRGQEPSFGIKTQITQFTKYITAIYAFSGGKIPSFYQPD